MAGLVPYLQAEQKDNQQDPAAAVKAGTKVKAELESAVDTRTAKPGDEVVARVTKDVKQDGKAVVRKGDRLKGRITEVKAPQAKGEAKAAGEAGSRVAVVFDRLVQGESTSQLNAVLTTVLSTPAEQHARQEESMREEPMRPAPQPTPSPAPSGGSAAGNAGLVGGVASTAGSVAGVAGSATGATAGAVDSTLSGAGSTLGATTDATLGSTVGAAVATPAKAIHLDSQARAQNRTGASSVLSTRDGHLRLDSGTQLEFRVAGQADGQAKPQ
ncbi:MAG: hypothetical protein ACRD4D_09270 [Candidatus Acidiferrales bacterium]